MGSCLPFKKVLFLAANPEGTVQLRLHKEMREIETKLKQSKQGGRLFLKQRGAVRKEDLKELLLDFKPHIVHFSGHGQSAHLSQKTSHISQANSENSESSELVHRDFIAIPANSTDEKAVPEINYSTGGLVLEDEHGKPELVSGKELTDCFKAVENNIECVVLNCCYSDSQAEEIAKYIPLVIGMKQTVEDDAAIKFSADFYYALGSGRKIKDAYNYAVELGKIPKERVGFEEQTSKLKLAAIFRECRKFRPAVWSSLLVTFIILLVRTTGALQAHELMFYDQLMRQGKLRPDPRLLIVTMTESDYTAQKVRDGKIPDNGLSLSNATLQQLLEKLDKFEPTTISLDFYRGQSPGDKLDQQLDQQLERDLKRDNSFGTCKVKDDVGENNSYEPPPLHVPPHQIGFSDFASLDPDGNILRRHLLGFQQDAESADEEGCKTGIAFSLLVANDYLKKTSPTQLKDGSPFAVDKDNKSFFVDDRFSHCPDIEFTNGAVLPKFKFVTGGYQGGSNESTESNYRGCQTLLRYRGYDSENLEEPFKIFSVEEILEMSDGEIEKFKNEKKQQSEAGQYPKPIILIGVTRRNGGNDYWATPYGEMPGVIVQAHMISQILDAALKERPLIWVLPEIGEIAWFWIWALIGGSLVLAGNYTFWLKSPHILIAATMFVCVIQYGICVLAFYEVNLWLPFVPTAIALLATTSCIWLHTVLELF